jgi:hypothetical protein
MDGFLSLIGSFQPGSLPTWGTFGLAFAWIMRQHFENRRLRMLENKDDRDGYGALITTLQSAVTTMEAKHAADLAAIRVEHSATLTRLAEDHKRCEERLGRIEGELIGFHRQALMQSQAGLAVLPASPMVVAAAERAVAAASKAVDEKAGKP